MWLENYGLYAYFPPNTHIISFMWYMKYMDNEEWGRFLVQKCRFQKNQVKLLVEFLLTKGFRIF